MINIKFYFLMINIDIKVTFLNLDFGEWMINYLKSLDEESAFIFAA